MLENYIEECHETFNETNLFEGSPKSVVDELHSKFFNISRIFDCIGCDQCRINGKVQIKGLGTALKVLVSDTKQLSKSELISLV